MKDRQTFGREWIIYVELQSEEWRICTKMSHGKKSITIITQTRRWSYRTRNKFFFFTTLIKRRVAAEFEMKDWQTFGKETEHLCRVAVGKMENVYKNESWQKKHYNNNTDKTLIVPYEKSFFFFLLLWLSFAVLLPSIVEGKKESIGRIRPFFTSFFAARLAFLTMLRFLASSYSLFHSSSVFERGPLRQRMHSQLSSWDNLRPMLSCHTMQNSVIQTRLRFCYFWLLHKRNVQVNCCVNLKIWTVISHNSKWIQKNTVPIKCTGRVPGKKKKVNLVPIRDYVQCTTC